MTLPCGAGLIRLLAYQLRFQRDREKAVFDTLDRMEQILPKVRAPCRLMVVYVSVVYLIVDRYVYGLYQRRFS
jgi:hypothetical protein